MDPIEQIKIIKQKRNISQETIAKEIGVCLLTVHRWLFTDRRPSLLSSHAIEAWINKNTKYME